MMAFQMSERAIKIELFCIECRTEMLKGGDEERFPRELQVITEQKAVLENVLAYRQRMVMK